MNEQIKKLGRFISEGDTNAAKELARELLRAGYLRVEGKEAWVIKNEETGLFWGGTKRGWSGSPHLYKEAWARKTATKLSKDARSKSVYNEELDEFQILTKCPQITLHRVRYLVLEEEKLPIWRPPTWT